MYNNASLHIQQRSVKRAAYHVDSRIQLRPLGKVHRVPTEEAHAERHVVFPVVHPRRVILHPVDAARAFDIEFEGRQNRAIGIVERDMCVTAVRVPIDCL